MRRNLTYHLTLTALFAALMAVSAFFYIPLAVPITLQTLVFFSALFILGGRDATAATLIYISLGALGLPVFAGFTGGISRLLDATGGYIVGMLLGALAYLAITHFFPNFKWVKIIAATAALLVIYTFGTLWFTFAYTNNAETLGAVLLTCVVLFVIPDLLKLALAYYIASRLDGKIKRA